MSYIPHTEQERQEMLARIGVTRIEELFSAIPEKFRFPRLNLPAPITEMEAMWELGALADVNADVNHTPASSAPARTTITSPA